MQSGFGPESLGLDMEPKQLSVVTSVAEQVDPPRAAFSTSLDESDQQFDEVITYKVSGWTPINAPLRDESDLGETEDMTSSDWDGLSSPFEEGDDAESDATVEMTPEEQKVYDHSGSRQVRKSSKKPRYTAVDKAWFTHQLQHNPDVCIEKITERSRHFTQLYEAFIQTGENSERTRHSAFRFFQVNVRKPLMQTMVDSRLKILQEHHLRSGDLVDEDKDMEVGDGDEVDRSDGRS